MAIEAAAFRTNFPEFANTAYPTDGLITFWLTVAYQLINPDRWGAMIDLGAQLFAAHNISLELSAQDEAAVGQGAPGSAPGVVTGPISSSSVDKVSITYATAESLEDGAGHWNTTVYGTRFWRLLRMMGMGPVYVGGGWGCGGAFLSFGAWPGPFWYGGSGLQS